MYVRIFKYVGLFQERSFISKSPQWNGFLCRYDCATVPPRKLDRCRMTSLRPDVVLLQDDVCVSGLFPHYVSESRDRPSRACDRHKSNF
jgi:hypothetical protein